MLRLIWCIDLAEAADPTRPKTELHDSADHTGPCLALIPRSGSTIDHAVKPSSARSPGRLENGSRNGGLEKLKRKVWLTNKRKDLASDDADKVEEIDEISQLTQ
jgi:hypothetical protein